MILDEDLEFNADTKRYYLTQDYVYNKMGIDLGSILYDELDTNRYTLPQRTIKKSCDILYGFLLANAIDKKSALYAVTVNKDMHNAMKEALESQLFYFIQNGLISQESGHQMSETVSAEAIQILKAAGVFHIIVPHIPEEW